MIVIARRAGLALDDRWLVGRQKHLMSLMVCWRAGTTQTPGLDLGRASLGDLNTIIPPLWPATCGPPMTRRLAECYSTRRLLSDTVLVQVRLFPGSLPCMSAICWLPIRSVIAVIYYYHKSQTQSPCWQVLVSDWLWDLGSTRLIIGVDISYRPRSHCRTSTAARVDGHNFGYCTAAGIKATSQCKYVKHLLRVR